MNNKLLKLAKMLLKFNEISTDKGVLTINEDLAIGIEAFITDENGEFIPAADGDYETDIQIITITDGKVSDIKDKETEPTTVEEPVNNEEEPIEEPVSDEKDARIAELEGLLKDRDAIIEELNAKIKELEDKLAKPVEEPVEMKSQVDERVNRVKINPALRYFED